MMQRRLRLLAGLQGSDHLVDRSGRVTKSLSTSHRRCDSEAARERAKGKGKVERPFLRLD